MLEKPQPLDRYFDQLMDMPIDVPDVIDCTSGSIHSWIAGIAVRHDERARNELLQERSAEEWLVLSRDLLELKQIMDRRDREELMKEEIVDESDEGIQRV